MTNDPASTRAALGGTAILMACACGAAANSAKLVALGGVAASTKLLHPVFIGVAAALVVYGLWRTFRPSGYLAAGAFATLAAGAVLTPPSVMSVKALPWDAVQVAGAGLYIVAAGILGYAFWRAFPSPRPAASATAIGGAALATGCSCCLMTGAVAGLAVTAGASAPLVESTPLLFWSGLAAVSAGLFRLGGLRAALWVPAGGLIVKYGPEVLKLSGDWVISGVNLRFLPSYLVTIAGTGAIMYGFAVAHQVAGSRLAEASWAPLGREPALADAARAGR
ncbi:MAG: hypothetical protein M3Q75_05385 [Gemmatimonadota bacterium]|nr:hypothetical protein [Gemmatimonadota bacterium]